MENLINQRQLADRLGVHPMTVSAMLRRWADFPVVQQGSKGKPYLFDPDQAVAFVQAKEAEQQRRAQDLQRQLEAAGTAPPFGHRERQPETDLDDLIKGAKLRALQRQALIEQGDLLPTHEVRITLERAFRRFGDALDGSIERVVRAQNVPDSMRRALEREFADMRMTFVRDVAAELQAGDGDGDSDELAG